MLESLTIRNFQGHSNLHIQFDKRITTLVGPSDIGKSSILRALKWVCLNSFDGPADSFVRWGAKSAIVELKVDGHTIIRKKSKRTNLYLLDGEELKAFGAGKVPVPIADLLNIGTENFQDQMENHFWLSDSPGQISRHLNRIVNLNKLDDAMGNILSQVRKSKTVLDVCTERLETAAKSRIELAWVPDADASLQKLEAQQEQINEIKQRRGVLHKALENIDNATSHAANARRKKEKLEEILARAKALTQTTANIAKLEEFLAVAHEARELARIRNAVLPDLSTLQKTKQHRATLSRLLSEIKKQKNILCKQKNIMDRLKENLKQVKVCPICKQPLETGSP